MNGEVVITGMGVVTPIGDSVASFWAGNLAGRSGLSREHRMDLSALPCGWVVGMIPDDIRESVRARSAAPGRSWTDTIMRDAVDQALTDAGLVGPLDRPAGLLWTGIWPGPSGSLPAEYVTHMKRAAKRYNLAGDDPGSIIAHLRRHPPQESSELSTFLADLSGRLGTPMYASRLEATCSGGLRAIVEATRLLRAGTVDVAVVAASVSRSTPYVISQYAQLMALSRWRGEPAQASMPFDRRRSGMVLNECAGALVLETAEHARRRGVAETYAAVGGWGLAVGTDHVTAPNIELVERVMRTAIRSSGATPQDIDTVNAHGTSTRLNDVTEAQAMHRIFGERTAELDVCAVKSIIGHGSAASGVVESTVAALTLCHGVIPPVVTCTEPDPACDVKTSLTPVQRPVRTVLKNSFGFGGQYASVVFTRPERPRQHATGHND